MALILSILVGAGLGGLMGYYGKCASGTCPLTATPGRGAIYGMVLGLLFYSSLARSGAGSARQSTANVRLVNEAEFESAMAQTNSPVVVDFFASWCGPCKRLGPLLDELAGPLTNQIKFLKVDVDKCGSIAERYRVEGVPTLVFLRDGKVVGRQVGLASKDELQTRLNSLASTAGGSVAKK